MLLLRLLFNALVTLRIDALPCADQVADALRAVRIRLFAFRSMNPCDLCFSSWVMVMVQCNCLKHAKTGLKSTNLCRFSIWQLIQAFVTAAVKNILF